MKELEEKQRDVSKFTENEARVTEILTMKRNMLTGSYCLTSHINGILSSKMSVTRSWHGDIKTMSNRQNSGKKRYSEECYTGIDMDAEEGGKCAMDYLCIHRPKRRLID